jgi:hypothetical protein
MERVVARGQGSGMQGSKRAAVLAMTLALLGLQAAPGLAAAAKKSDESAARPASSFGGPHASAAVARGMGDTNPSQQVLQALSAMHLTACAGTVQQATNFLFEGQDANFVAQPLGPDADRWPTVFVVESADPTGSGHNRFATLVVSPNCSGMYEQTIYWPQPCALVKSTVFAKFTGEHVLLSDVKVSDSGPALQVFLMPAGAGCVSVKKELFH